MQRQRVTWLTSARKGRAGLKQAPRVLSSFSTRGREPGENLPLGLPSATSDFPVDLVLRARERSVPSPSERSQPSNPGEGRKPWLRRARGRLVEVAAHHSEAEGAQPLPCCANPQRAGTENHAAALQEQQFNKIRRS